ncbi:hypothetical protein Molly5_6 [Maribacter phage Molly_5]|uniref:Uncharacterized protein n=2 Tax=Mollyvirus TaxID=2948826 RepID=A0A8E4UY14_9CAUD|nr:hypothetical protein M1M29_gp006 [Maribacter phage Molly_1]YP_010357254.1 hypothetical protein M1M30_gp005 [Maribacter phage Colly_1]QQO97744.1 hypothetical protein Molly2_6 [Maribacter phage Molly_2]QQO97944.1 hypothetical protein Molly3_6 [Maribacter phage Molly_3]QQO98144.1 hypothetical protein Molly4_6 [Maribacter phage Molly_4]QQO98344.1 hypothetical protein Molly5_6 [Maribacter phage Molly_5]QQO97333.1 hypothetical protein Colly1_5 [Maribacter phage Colly_1]
MRYVKSDQLKLSKLRVLSKFLEGHKGFIAGGVFKDIFNNKPFKDIDIFFRTEEDLADAIAYFTDKVDSKDNKVYWKYYENKQAIAFKTASTSVTIELIKTTVGTPREVMTQFDFSITRFAYGHNKNSSEDATSYIAIYDSRFFEHLVTKKLVLEAPDQIKFPVSTFDRSYRYAKYGYGLCKESKQNLIEALQGADINDLSNSLYFGID